MEKPTTEIEPKPRRHLLRLSVRALMLLVLVLAVVLGWFVHRARVQREAVAAIREARGIVVYDFQRVAGKPIDLKAEPNAPRWLVEMIGVDYFGNIVAVTPGRNPDDAMLAHVGRLPRLVNIQIAINVPNQITDAGLAHLVDLRELEHLSLRGSKVRGSGLANIRGLTRLRDLNLFGLPIGDADLAHLEPLKALESLDLSRTLVGDEGLEHLAGLANLEHLNLTSTPVTDAGLAHLEGLARLKTLQLASTGVRGEGLKHLGRMSQLGRLYLMRSKVANLSTLPPLPGLKWLNLDNNPIDDAQLAPLSKLPALELLNVRGTSVTDAGLATLLGLKGTLGGLALSGNRITDASAPLLLQMENLSGLQLDGTQITDATLDQIAGLKGLKAFEVKGAPVTEAGIARLRKALPGLKVTQGMANASGTRNQPKAKAASPPPPSSPGPQP